MWVVLTPDPGPGGYVAINPSVSEARPLLKCIEKRKISMAHTWPMHGLPGSERDQMCIVKNKNFVELLLHYQNIKFRGQRRYL